MAPASGFDPGFRGQSPTEVADEIAKRYFGALARWQLLPRGISSSRIERWRAAGRLHPHYPGVYSWGRAELSEKGQISAGLLFAGRGSALTGISALWWLDALHRRPDLIQIDAPGYARSRQDLQIHHPRRIERHFHEDLPYADIPRVLIKAAADLSHDSLRLVLARLDFQKLLTLSSLQAACATGPVGSKAVRKAMDSHLPALAKCVNGFERDFVLLCESHGLPIPEPNERIGRRVPDMLWRPERLIVELDGQDAHTSPAQKIDDQVKQEWLESLGYTVIRFTWAEVYFQAGYVAARVRAALASA
jgi:hypothetical protein